MKLLLTSSGLANEKIKQFFINQFDRLDNKTAALITSIRTKEDHIYNTTAKKKLKSLGIEVREIDITKDDIYTSYPKFDIYYVCGGNAYYILDRMRATGMDKILIDAVKKGNFYFGVSAGSILAGPDIEAAGVGKNADINDIGLYNLGSFNLVPFIIFPHYTEENKKEVIGFKKYRFQEPVIALADNQAIHITETETVLVGERGGLQFCEEYRLKDFIS